jgi:hypothetical protein
VYIGIAGPMGAGKDTLAAYLRQMWCLHGELSEVRHFAAPLRGVVAALTHLTPQELETAEGKATEVWERRYTAGQLLQKLGAAVRSVDKEAFVLAAFAGLEGAGVSSAPIIFSDVRFPAEAEAIRSRGGRLALIQGRSGRDDGRDAADVSETALDSYWATKPPDAVIDNSGTLEDLEAAAEALHLAWKRE